MLLIASVWSPLLLDSSPSHISIYLWALLRLLMLLLLPILHISLHPIFLALALLMHLEVRFWDL